MNTGVGPEWVWEATNPMHSGSSGDISKLFRNEVVKKPGAFASSAPSDVATLMAREVIQNSADAARELRTELADEAPEFELDFVFDSLIGDDKTRLVESMNLGALAGHIDAIDGPLVRGRLGLTEHDCLQHLDDDEPLRLLRIDERGTTGMYGPFTDANSKLYLALISLGYTAKPAGSGGSYGYGKAGLIRGSKIRTVVAYTRFRERTDDAGVTRRLLGMTYWGQHYADGASFKGFARFGHHTDDGVEPFENDAADAVAERLGITVRDAEDDSDLGTTFLLVDPGVEADDLLRAIERNWWPAIEDDELTATVIVDGVGHVPRPRRDAVLKPFVDAYDLALSPPDNTVPEQKRAVLSSLETSDGTRHELGALGLVAESGGWSYATNDPDSDDGVGHRSLVALVRGPRMVVEYFDAGMTRPYVRGVFVAADAVDDLLRQTEPKGHDAWQTSVDEGGVDAVAPEVARAIVDRVKRNVNDFRRSLKPPPRPAEDVRLPELEKLFRSLLHARGNEPSPPPQGDRPFSIQVSQTIVEDAVHMNLRLEGRVKLALIDRPEFPDSCLADLSISYRIMEDGGVGQGLALAITPPNGFDSVDGSTSAFRGAVSHDYLEFSFVSEPYPADWTGRLKAHAEIVAVTEGVVGS